MLRYGLFLCLLINTATIKASCMPPYFNEDIEAEYRAFLKHAGDILPRSDLHLAYLPLFYPFSFLDISTSKFKSDNDKQAFSNFNLGYGTRIPVQNIYKIIIEWLEKDKKPIDTTEKVISDEDKKILAERLRKLGYVI